ncbi:dihydroorotate dehydrogenase (quinone), mitochondrial isoform X2 [Prorops nasuta]
MKFRNPIGMAAGFDKHAEAVQGLSNCGFGFVEIGSVTPEPQEGNPKPRVFRLPEDKATINRYGFNSEGYSIVWSRLKKLREAKESDIIIGVNLGKNKNTEDAAEDYVNGIKTFSDVADYFVINVSSPNTPNLRTLQRKQKLEDLLAAINKIRESSNIKTPLFLKLAPDLSSQERQDIADVIQNNKTKVDGLILCNTTINRPNLINTNYENETGGLSGAPLNYISTTMISDMYKRTKGTIPIIGVGGVFSGEDALAKIKAGASLVQLYTSYTYYGPPIVSKIKTELNDLLKKEGYNSVADAVGKNNIIK